MKGVCAKQEVKAVIVAIDGSVYEGTNFCNNAQNICPRDIQGYESGQGYYLCKDVCNQSAHAEINALKSAGKNAKGATLYLTGHTYACDNCKSACSDAGISKIVIC